MKNKNFISSRQNFNSNGSKTYFKNNKLKNILSWLLIAILCFTVIGSVLGTVAFGRTQTASADTVASEYIYEGKNIFVPTTSAYPKINDYTYQIHFFSVDLKLEKSHFYLRHNINAEFRVTCYLPSFRLYLDTRYYPLSLENDNPLGFNMSGGGELSNPDENNFVTIEPYFAYYNFYNKLSDGYLDTIDSMEEINNNSQVAYHLFPYFDDADSSSYFGYYGYITYSCDIGFNGDIYSVSYSSSESESVKFFRVYNTLTYRDKNGYTCSISFRSTVSKSTVRTGYIAWEDRTYYLENALNDNSSYYVGYDKGYSEGKNDGVIEYRNSNQFYTDAKNQFYSNFVDIYKESVDYKTEIANAKWAGALEERENGNNYNFVTVLSAMYNAPLGAFRDFLSFELLGVNLLGFFTGLFTIAFVLFVIKKLT